MLLHRHNQLSFLVAITILISISGSQGFSSVGSTWTEADLLNERNINNDDGNNKDFAAVTKSREIKIRAELVDGCKATDQFFATTKDSNKNNSSDDISVTTKIVHFQRHGQGYHNLLGDILRDVGVRPNINSNDTAVNPWRRSEIIDSPLTELGKQQCERQQKVASKLAPQVMIVSPLLRAVQTAKLSFANYTIDRAGSSDIPWIAHEGCREDLGWYLCNKRRNLSEIKNDFPELQFLPSEITEHDEIFDHDNFESETSKSNRIYDFLATFISRREEQNIAVVTHSSWLFHMCNTVMDCGGDANLTSRFQTGEIRSMKLTFCNVSSNTNSKTS